MTLILCYRCCRELLYHCMVWHCGYIILFIASSTGMLFSFLQVREGTQYSTECGLQPAVGDSTIVVPASLQLSLYERLLQRHDHVKGCFDLETTGFPGDDIVQIAAL